MAFDDVRLSDAVEQGAQGGPKFQTSIVALGNGAEQRNSDWSRTRSTWDISYGVQYKEEVQEIIDFFYARRGKARGFRFKDWFDYQAVDQAIGVGDGVKTAFQLVKNYTSVVTYARKITRPVAGTSVLKVNGVVVSGTVNNNTGVATLLTAPALGAVVSASFEFDFPARFDTDELRLNVRLFNVASIPAIPIIEIYE